MKSRLLRKNREHSAFLRKVMIPVLLWAGYSKLGSPAKWGPLVASPEGVDYPLGTLNSGSRCRQGPPPQPIQVGPAIPLAFDPLHPVYLPFHWTTATAVGLPPHGNQP
jgi:hypothetical protein